MTTGAPTHQIFFGLPRTLWRDLIRMGYITKHQTSGMLELRHPGHSQTIRVTTYVSNQSVKACRITKFMTHTTHPIPHHACNAFYRDVSYRGHRGQGHAFIMPGYLYLQLGSFTVVLLLDCSSSASAWLVLFRFRTLYLYINVNSLLNYGKRKAYGAGAPGSNHLLWYNNTYHLELRYSRFAVMGALSHHEISRLG